MNRAGRYPEVAGILFAIGGCARAAEPAHTISQDERAAAEAQLQQQVVQQNASMVVTPMATSTVTDETAYRQTQEQFEAWCASDRGDRRATAAQTREAEAAVAAEREKKTAEAKTRSDYIKKNCRTLMKPNGPPVVCLDDDGFLRDCGEPPEVYVECPAAGPNGLRGVIGQGVKSNASPARAARARSNYAGTAPTPEPTKDERCRKLDEAAQ